MKRFAARLIPLLALVLATPSVHADESPPPADGGSTEAGPRGRPVIFAVGVVPLVTWLGPKGPRDAEVVTPTDRFAITQIIGAGYVVNPSFRVALVALFSETLSGLPPRGSTWQLGAIAPIAVGTFDYFVIGGGPILADRSGGTNQFDAGFVLLPGVSIPLGSGFAFNGATPLSGLFVNRVALSLGAGIGVAKVF